MHERTHRGSKLGDTCVSSRDRRSGALEQFGPSATSVVDHWRPPRTSAKTRWASFPAREAPAKTMHASFNDMDTWQSCSKSATQNPSRTHGMNFAISSFCCCTMHSDIHTKLRISCSFSLTYA